MFFKTESLKTNRPVIQYYSHRFNQINFFFIKLLLVLISISFNQIRILFNFSSYTNFKIYLQIVLNIAIQHQKTTFRLE